MNRLVGLIILIILSFGQNSLSASEWDWDFKNLNPFNWLKSSHTNDLSYESLHKDTIGGVAGKEIKIYMLRQAGRMKAADKEALVSVFRKGEVLKISIPSEYLFLPNDTLVASFADKKLNPVLTLLNKNLTNLIVVGYSDNTGSKKYIKQISVQRANGVADWFSKKGIAENRMGVYALGDKHPVFDNKTMYNRSQNRRIVLYLVPNQKMIKLAKKRELNVRP